jgi:hypothetical protein
VAIFIIKASNIHVENNLTFNKIYDYRYFQGFGHSVGGEIGFLLWGWKPD